jgi:saccharopine dehydrogenase-like NADP-dependent oxidoreductase
MKHSIFIAGSGGIGQAAGLLLQHSAQLEASLYFGDVSAHAIDSAIQFVQKGSPGGIPPIGVLMPMEGTSEALENILEECSIILDCLPGNQAPRMAALAKKHGCHYANLTEYVQETQEIMSISEGADTAFVLQTGLAPGFINILAHQLFQEFCTDYGVEKANSLSMKVGAISQNAPSPHYYAFTWSPIGVATEYLKDAEVVRNFKKIKVPALSGLERIIIDGDEYEDNFTSGGAADLPDAFAGKIKNLDYKTIRYPGHYQWVRNTLSTLVHSENKIKDLERIMLENIPSVEDDMVVIYASVEGADSGGRLRRKEKSYKIMPSYIGNIKLRAIQTTTAAPLCEVAFMLLKNNLKGTILQSQLPPLEFLNGPFVSAIYGKYS